VTDPSDRPAGRAARIRAAQVEDLDDLVALYAILDEMQRPWRTFAPQTDPLADALARFRVMIDDPAARLVVAEDPAGSVVGMGMGRIEKVSSSSDEPALELTNVVVLPAHRGRGVGNAIAAELVRFARDRGVRLVALRVFSENDGAIAFWSGLGFRPRFVQMVAEAADVP
jgi:ribosomal protein S18 acetylase RimI-like enzyme